VLSRKYYENNGSWLWILTAMNDCEGSRWSLISDMVILTVITTLKLSQLDIKVTWFAEEYSLLVRAPCRLLEVHGRFRAIAMEMEAVFTSETSVYFYQNTRRCIQEGYRLHTRRHENLKSNFVVWPCHAWLRRLVAGLSPRACAQISPSDLWWTSGTGKGFSPNSSVTTVSPYSHIMWGMNNRPVGGRSSET
jgi:hypothetical protein